MPSDCYIYIHITLGYTYLATSIITARAYFPLRLWLFAEPLLCYKMLRSIQVQVYTLYQARPCTVSINVYHENDDLMLKCEVYVFS